MDTLPINVLDTEIHIINTPQKQHAYCRYMHHHALHIPSVANKLMTKDNSLFKTIQDVGPQSLALTILVNS